MVSAERLGCDDALLNRLSNHPGDPVRKYLAQQYRAVLRGIPWEFTLATWWAAWEASGKWELRGNLGGQFCMTRRWDLGPYSPDNVRIRTNVDNVLEAADHAGGKRGLHPPRKSARAVETVLGLATTDPLDILIAQEESHC